MSAVGLIPFEKATCAHLCELLNKWREPGPAQRVRSALVVPEAANREYTLLSVEHVHFIASKIRAEGFRGRRPGSNEGHDIPVLTRCGPIGKRDALGQESLDSWRARSAHHKGYPTCEVNDQTPMYFCSLGNGHFFQALNLFRLSWPNILGAPARHVVPPGETALRDAIDNGVPSVVLRPETPRNVRMEISLLLNQTHLQKWDVDAQGRAFALPVEPELPGARKISQFEAISKVCDSEMLGSLLRGKLGIDETLADSGYEAPATDGSVKSAYRPLDAGAPAAAVNSNSNLNAKAAMTSPSSKL